MKTPPLSRTAKGAKPQKAIHHATFPSHMEKGKWVYAHQDRNVVVLATSGNWAMVRIPSCMPYVCHVKELTWR